CLCAPRRASAACRGHRLSRGGAERNGKVGFALIGTGMAGVFDAKDLQHVDGAELVAVCSRSQERVREFSASHGVPFWYTDFREAVMNPEGDGVHVLVATRPHVDG